MIFMYYSTTLFSPLSLFLLFSFLISSINLYQIIFIGFLHYLLSLYCPIESEQSICHWSSLCWLCLINFLGGIKCPFILIFCFPFSLSLKQIIVEKNRDEVTHPIFSVLPPPIFPLLILWVFVFIFFHVYSSWIYIVCKHGFVKKENQQ